MILVALGLSSLYPLVAFGLDRYGLRRPEGEYDAIVVAGCRVMPSGAPSPALARRTELAVRLWEEGLAPRIVLTGGQGESEPRSEAEAAAELAEELGVPREAMVLEDRSTSTEENARFAAELVGGDARVVVVSDAYHVYRCERVFARWFGAVDGAGSVGDAWPRMRGALREVAALTAYAIGGKLG